jgi:hypothetical protein
MRKPTALLLERIRARPNGTTRSSSSPTTPESTKPRWWRVRSWWWTPAMRPAG